MSGDVMLGRLIDQLWPMHNKNDEDMLHTFYMLSREPEKSKKIPKQKYKYIWGDMLPLMLQADLRVINLETCVTTNDHKWPNKQFNYRMHPENLKCLTEAKIDYCSLANNHTLDYGYNGMYETMRSLTQNNIHWAGVGANSKEAIKPTYITAKGVKFAMYSFADHPSMWAAKEDKPGVNFIDIANYTAEDMEKIKKQIQADKESENPQVVICSLHWGPNYEWEPSRKFRDFAKALIDAGVDVIHGHSTHHIQGIEVYKGKPILYGCGDFVDDYAVEDAYRNDLGCAFFLDYDLETKKFSKLEIVPGKIDLFNIERTMSGSKEYNWIAKTMKRLSSDLGTTVEEANGSLVIKM